ncbi:hypothetical protein EV702DRAFT_1200233 [Suillus placidus]|uniref:Uncharacterized protein n=1 Tax=Suillus placidus TaxID=48579 RepID=A0A9P6ZQI0_9AGAM|nr:hypothetical protein EV702DRAFT_1200233 [Suillus placidus]
MTVLSRLKIEAAKQLEPRGHGRRTQVRLDIPPHRAGHTHEINGMGGYLKALEVVEKLSLPEHLIELQLTLEMLDH